MKKKKKQQGIFPGSLDKTVEAYYEKRKRTDPPYRLGEGRERFDEYPLGCNIPIADQ